MKYSGYHLMIDLFGCYEEQLEDTEYITNMLEELPNILNTKIKVKAYYKFEPQGFSGVLIISASHITIHTWPEDGYAGIDIFTCSKDFDSEVMRGYIENKLQHKGIEMKEFYRGVIN